LTGSDVCVCAVGRFEPDRVESAERYANRIMVGATCQTEQALVGRFTKIGDRVIIHVRKAQAATCKGAARAAEASAKT